MHDELYFAATDGTHGVELWRSDGTSAGTTLVQDLNVGPDSSSPGQLFATGSMLLFAAGDAAHGWELWRLDHEAGPARLICDVRPGKDSSYPGHFVNWNETVAFTADDDYGNLRLWVIDKARSSVSLLGTPLTQRLKPASE
jgi:ELWxxDGT repeat protein